VKTRYAFRVLRGKFCCFNKIVVLFELWRRWCMDNRLTIFIQFRCRWLLNRRWGLALRWFLSLSLLRLRIASFHDFPCYLIHRSLNQIFVISLRRPFLDLRYLKFWHINGRLLRFSFTRGFLCRCWWRLAFGSTCRVLLFFFNTFQLLDSFLFLVFLESLLFELLLLFFGLFDEQSLYLLSFALIEHFKGYHALTFKLKEEIVHCLWVRIHYLYVLYIVVAVSACDLIQQIKALL
jgi:hypothetical protein